MIAIHFFISIRRFAGHCVFYFYVNLGILKFPDIAKLQSCLFFFDIFNDFRPSNLTIPLLSEQHRYTTRNVSLEQLYIPFYRTNIRKFSPTIIGRYFWNDLPLSIHPRPTKKLFKNSLFSHYLSKSYINSRLT